MSQSQYPHGAPPRPEGPPPGHHKWNTGATVLSALAAAVTAIVAVVALNAGGDDDKSSTTTKSSTPVADTAVPQPPPTTPTVKEPAPGADTVRWTGDIVLGSEGYLIDPKPPKRGESLGGYDVKAGRQGSSGMEVKGTVAPLSGAVSPAACRDLLQTQSVSVTPAASGDKICIRNESGRFGVLEVTDTDYDAPSYGLVKAKLTVWEQRMPK